MNRADQFKKTILSSALVPNGVKNFFFGDFGRMPQLMNQEASAFKPWERIAPIQFFREKVDLQTWRDAVEEMERQMLPYRVIAQRIYLDVALNAHVIAAIQKRKNQVLMKDFEICVGETVDERATELLKTQWFDQLQSYILDAEYYGYSPIALGPMINFTFPKLRIIKRENVSPDRECISPIIYSPQGLIYFNDPEQKDKAGNAYSDWIIYVDTPHDGGHSNCGYGLFYKIAQYDIYLRNNLADNATYNEMFGMPFRELKADFSVPKDEINAENRLKNSGSAGYIITPKDSELIYHNQQGGGNGYKSYESLETRLEKKITKIILGHEDAMGAKPGKLGAVSLDVMQSLRDAEKSDLKILRHAINNQVIPKLANIGFPIKEGSTIRYKNDKEEMEAKQTKAKANAEYIDQLVKLGQAGYKVDVNEVAEVTGYKLTEIEQGEIPEAKINEEVKNQLRKLYGDT